MLQSSARIAIKATASSQPKDRRPSGADSCVAVNFISRALWRRSDRFASLNLRSPSLRNVPRFGGGPACHDLGIFSAQRVAHVLGTGAPRLTEEEKISRKGAKLWKRGYKVFHRPIHLQDDPPSNSNGLAEIVLRRRDPLQLQHGRQRPTRLCDALFYLSPFSSHLRLDAVA